MGYFFDYLKIRQTDPEECFEIRRELGYPDSITARCIKVFACDRNWADKQIDTVIRDLTWSYKK
jgi:hypothetical protein